MDKPTIVLVHGMFCHAGVFEKIVEHFEAKGYECYALNLPYHDALLSKTPHPNLATVGINDYVDYLVESLEHLKKEYVLVGHSMGGLITMKTASLANIHPKAIVLLAPAAPWGIFALKYTVIKSFYDVLTTMNFWKMPINLSYENICYSMLNQLPEAERRAIYNGLRWESGKAAFQMGIWPLDSSKATQLDPAGITCSIIIFAGKKDRITPFGVIKNTAKFLDLRPNILVRFFERLSQIRKGQWQKQEFRRVKFIDLPEMGHWLITELDPQLILAEIESALLSP